MSCPVWSGESSNDGIVSRTAACICKHCTTQEILCSNKKKANAAGLKNVIVCLELELIKKIKTGTRSAFFSFWRACWNKFYFLSISFFNLNPFQSWLSVLSMERGMWTAERVISFSDNLRERLLTLEIVFNVLAAVKLNAKDSWSYFVYN